MRPIELVRALVEQMRCRFIALAGSKQGRFKFVEGERSSEEETMRDAINPIALISHGVFAAYATHELEALLAPVMAHQVLAAARPPVAVPSLHLPIAGKMALDAITGRDTLAREIDEVVNRRIADRTCALASVFVALSCGAFGSPPWPLTRRSPNRAEDLPQP